MRYCGRQKNGKALLLTDDEIINNALEQEKSGIKPHYAFYDYKKHKKITPAGWLVWSLSDGGCGVVYRRKDGKMIITTGLQGDFCYCQGVQYERFNRAFKGFRAFCVVPCYWVWWFVFIFLLICEVI